MSVAGGADVAQQLLAAKLIDEFTLSVVPVVLGGGTRMLDNLGVDLKLAQADVVRGARRDAPEVPRRALRAAGASPSEAHRCATA